MDLCTATIEDHVAGPGSMDRLLDAAWALSADGITHAVFTNVGEVFAAQLARVPVDEPILTLYLGPDGAIRRWLLASRVDGPIVDGIGYPQLRGMMSAPQRRRP